MGFLAQLGFTGIINLFTTLWPIVNAAIHVAETANPNPGAGAQKFNNVLNNVTSVALALPDVVTATQKTGAAITDATQTGDIKQLQSAIGDVINIAVKLANAVGAFQKSGFVQQVTQNQLDQPNSGG